jgi:hypothetical protein
MHIQSLTGKMVLYNFIENRKYESITDRFLKNTFIALDHLHYTNALTITYNDDGIIKTVDIIDVLTDDTVNNITIIPGNRNAYNHKLNSIMFLDTHGVVFKKNHRRQWFKKNKGYNSPVALLSHELIHCYNELYETEDYLNRKRDQSGSRKKIDFDGNNLSYPNAEEEFVIKMTNQVVEILGEDKRSNYGRNYYQVQNVLSVEKLKKMN